MTIAHRFEEADSPLDRLLSSCTGDRLHIGLVLVARARLTPVEALTLTWDDVDPVGLRLRLPDRDVRINAPFAELLHWQQRRQRVDALIRGHWFDPCGYVVADRDGLPFTLARADGITARLAVGVGLPPIPMSALRHPVLQ